jgi:hypothetical protein
MDSVVVFELITLSTKSSCTIVGHALAHLVLISAPATGDTILPTPEDWHSSCSWWRQSEYGTLNLIRGNHSSIKVSGGSEIRTRDCINNNSRVEYGWRRKRGYSEKLVHSRTNCKWCWDCWKL